MTLIRGWNGYRCPVDPEHGRLLDTAPGSKWSYYCPSQKHDGRRGGQAPMRAHFTLAEAENGVPTSRSPQHEPEAAGRTSSGVGRAGDLRTPVPEAGLG